MHIRYIYKIDIYIIYNIHNIFILLNIHIMMTDYIHHDDCLIADLLIGDSTLLLYFSKSTTRSRNSTIVPVFQNLSLFMCVLLCESKVFLSIVVLIVRIKQDHNCF